MQKSTEKRAVSPENAMTADDLRLPQRFEQAMQRKLGQLKIFVEINGKYYLDEQRFRQIREERAKARSSSGKGGRKGGIATEWSSYMSILLMLPIGLIVFLILFFVLAASGVSFFPREFLIILAIVIIGVAVSRLLFWQLKKTLELEMRKNIV